VREDEVLCVLFVSLGMCVAKMLVGDGFDVQRCIQSLGGVENILEDDLEL